MPIIPPDSAQSLPKSLLDGFTIQEVLYEAESPVVFTAVTHFGLTFLVYLADEHETGDWLVLAPTSKRIVDALHEGQVGVRETLTKSWIWLVKRVAGQVEAVWALESADMFSYLPRPNTLLSPP